MEVNWQPIDGPSVSIASQQSFLSGSYGLSLGIRRMHHTTSCRRRWKAKRATRLLCASALAISAALGATSALADRSADLVYASGHVESSDGQPLRGAIVAVYDDQNKVVDYAKTDDDGNYSIAVPKRAVHLDKHTKGFFATVFGGVEHLVGGAATFIANPVRAGVDTVTGTEIGLAVSPLAKGGIAAGGAVFDKIVFPSGPSSKNKQEDERKQPGVLVIKVSQPGHNDLMAYGHVYWVQQTLFKTGGRENSTLQAWVDPVKLTRAESESPSTIQSNYLKLTFARLEPSLAQPGDTVRIVAKMATPPAPEIYAVVVARNSRTGQKWELTPTGDDRYEAEIQIDPKSPRDDQIISVIAYAQENQHPGRRRDAEAAIEGAGLWDPRKPYKYDPALVVSRNRADLTLTVLAGPDRRRH